MEEKNYSFYLDQALDLLNSASDNCLDFDERTQKSIELAELLILDFKENISVLEKKKSDNLSKFYSLLKKGKAFFSNLMDQSFRSSSSHRIIDQISHLILQYGLPSDSSLAIKIKSFFFKIFGPAFPKIFTSLIQKKITKECLTLLCFAEKPYLHKYLQKNKNRETIFWLIQKPSFGSKTVEKNIKNILNFIQNPQISSFCINLSNLSSNISSSLNLLAIEEVEKNLHIILQAILDNPYKSAKEKRQKLFFLNFDTHKNLNLLIEIFEKLLFLEKFLKIKLGITLKAYFPESFEIQKKLIELAKKRIEKNGAPIVIRITKGSSLNLEQIEASKNNWPSPTFITKIETDANFKKMIEYGCKIDNIKAANLAVASCNIFDIAYSLFLIKENKIESYVFFEISEEKLTRSIRNSLEKLLDNNLKISCPLVNKKDFHLVSFFVLKKINDFTNPDNFIFHLELLFPGTKNWDEQLETFKQSLAQMKYISNTLKQQQNRTIIKNETSTNFENEPITDFSISSNIEWAKEIIKKAKNYIPEDIPIVINGEYIYDNLVGLGIIPSTTNNTYKYSLANESQIEKTITVAKQNEKSWFETPIEKRYKILSKVAQKLREKRAFFIQNIIVDISKSFEQADLEISDAIDAIEYQSKQMLNILSNKDIEWSAKGTFLIMPPWGFAVSAGVEAITSALISGNVVIYKPLEECVLISYYLANLFWEAGIPKECLQFLNCTNELFEKTVICDQRINSVIISTSSENAKKLFMLRNGAQLIALAGGINTIIVTDMSDKEQAIRDIINSAFKFSGQKFSSASILILEKNLYDDLEFRENLKDAASNLIADSAFEINSVITPLIKTPDEKLIKALTTLDEGEWWLVKPKQDPNNPRLFSCGIKYGVKADSFTKKNQLHGPILSVMRADNLVEAIKLANDSKYGLAAGLQSLDIREHSMWLKEIKAGNYYINTKITDAKIKRQPFGGYRESSFGSGYKSGGPNYILDFLKAKQIFLPKEKQPINDWVNSLTSFLEKIDLSTQQLGIWYASVANYAYWWKRLKQNLDFCKIFGQDNYLRYVPRKNITLRLTEKSFALDALRVCAAALTCSTPLEISWTSNNQLEKFNWIDLLPMLSNVEESKEEFYKRIEEGKIKRVRLTTPASEELKKIASRSICHIIDNPVLANGRFELLHYIKEITITYDYHRYGNLGSRESEIRKPLL